MEIDPPLPAPALAGEAAASVQPTAEETALQCASDHDLRVAYYCEENVWRLAYRMRHHRHDYHSRSGNDDDRFWVVFISNVIKNVPMFQQRASLDHADADDDGCPSKSVCWDYHVILVGSCTSGAAMHQHHRHHHQDADMNDDDDNNNSNNNNNTTTSMMVYDIDSRLPYPCPLQYYLQQSFPYEWPAPYNPMFRVIPADRFLSHFSSDRSHMLNRQGQYTAPPPPYAPIVGAAAATGAGAAVTGNNNNASNNNLQHYLNFVGRPHRTEMDEEALGQIWSKEQFAAAEFARD